MLLYARGAHCVRSLRRALFRVLLESFLSFLAPLRATEVGNAFLERAIRRVQLALSNEGGSRRGAHCDFQKEYKVNLLWV